MKANPRPKLIVCPSCSYPHRKDCSCPNPACYANPNVSDEVKAGWRARDERLAAESAERDRLAKIRRGL